MKNNNMKKVIIMFLIFTMCFSFTMPAFAENTNEVYSNLLNDLNLQSSSYIDENGFHENGSYEIQGKKYQYEQFNDNDGNISLKVYEVNDQARSINLEQEYYFDVNANVIYDNTNDEILVDLSTEAAPFTTWTDVKEGNTFFDDVQRFTVEGLAITLLTSTFTFGAVTTGGIGVLLGVAAAILEGFYGTFNCDYIAYTIGETFPPDKPYISVRYTRYVDYYNADTGAFIKRSGKQVQEYV